MLIENLDIYQVNYGIWRPVYKNHAYKNVTIAQVSVKEEFPAQGTKPKAEDFPRPLELVDDLPPQTVITHVQFARGKAVVRGTTADNGTVKRVVVNGQEARALRPNFAEWEAVLEHPGGPLAATAHAEDTAGNVEPRPHRVVKTP